MSFYKLLSLLTLAASLASPLLSLSQTLKVADATDANVSAMGRLRPGPGRQLILVNCLPCHSAAVIAASHLSRKQWDDTITLMQKSHGLWALAPSVRSQILDYLETTQPPRDPSVSKGSESPWATPLYNPNPLW